MPDYLKKDSDIASLRLKSIEKQLSKIQNGVDDSLYEITQNSKREVPFKKSPKGKKNNHFKVNGSSTARSSLPRNINMNQSTQ